MALTNWMPQFFTQTFEPAQMFQFPYIAFGSDRSSYVPIGNNQGSWPDVEGSVVTETYNPRTDLTETQGDVVVYVLTIDQKDAFSISLDDLDRVQKSPAVMAEYTVQGMRELFWAINDNNRTVYEGGSRLAASGLDAPIRGNNTGLDGNQHDLALAVQGKGSGTEISSADGRAAIVRAMDDKAGIFAKRHAWISPDADTKGVCVMPMEVASQLRQYLYDDKPNLGAGSIVDSAFGMGKILRVSGWEIVEDQTLGEQDLTQAGAVNLNFLHPEGKSLYYGRQLSRLRTEAIQKQFGDRLMGLYLHGATQGAARNLYQMRLVLS